MERVDGDSWNNKRLDVVTFSFQVSAHLFEYHAPPDSKEATHVLSDDPCRFCKPYNSKHLRPEMAVVFRSLPSSGLGKRLAGESPCENKG